MGSFEVSFEFELVAEDVSDGWGYEVAVCPHRVRVVVRVCLQDDILQSA